MAPQAQTTLTHVPFEGADKTRFVHIISNILTEDECNQIIKSHTDFVLSETTPGTIRYREGFDDPALANLIWKRIARFYEGERIQDEDGCWWTCIGLNDNMRLSKYEKSGKFTPHYDYRRLTDMTTQSFMSVNIYLNTVPESSKGATRILKHPHPGLFYIYDPNDKHKVLAKIQPVQGTASIFRETLWHDGEEVLDGVKYLLRTDLMFTSEDREFDFEKRTQGLSSAEKAKKAMEIAWELDDGGNREQAVVWYEKARELREGRGGEDE